MGQTVVGALGPGLALAGVLAIGGLVAARVGGRLPHLGVAAVGAAVAAGAGRAATLPVPVAVLVLAIGGAALGAIAFVVDDRIRRSTATLWPPTLLADAAVLGLALAVAALLRPALAVDLPLGPLGGVVSTLAGVVAFTIGVAGMFALVLRTWRADGVALWVVASAFMAVAVAVGAGGLAAPAGAIPTILGVVDTGGLAVRAAAVGVLMRVSPPVGLAGAVTLGVGELLLRTVPATGGLASLPALALLAAGVAWLPRLSARSQIHPTGGAP